MSHPEPLRVEATYLDPQATVTIGEETVDGPTLARVVDETRRGHEPKTNDLELTYEDVQVFCRAKGITSVPSIAAYNQMARRLTLQDPAAFMRNWVLVREGRRTMHYPGVGSYPPHQTIDDREGLIRFGTGVALTCSYDDFLARLQLTPSKEAFEFYQNRHYLVLSLLSYILLLPKKTPSLPIGTIRDIGQLLRETAILYRDLAKQSGRASDDGIAELKMAELLHAGLKVAALLSPLEVRLFPAFLQQCHPDTIHTALDRFPLLPSYFHQYADQSPSNQRTLANLFREETMRTGRFSHWLLLRTRLDPKDLKFLMGYTQKVGHQMSPKQRNEFSKTWERIVTGRFEPAVNTLRDTIDSFDAQWGIPQRGVAAIPPAERGAALETIKGKIVALRRQGPVHQLSKDDLFHLASLVEMARQLGAAFSEVGEPLAEIEPRLYGYLNHNMNQMPVMYLSETGFLGEGDKLSETIELDRNFLASQGFTAPQIGAPLEVIRAYSLESGRKHFAIQINEQQYRVENVGGFSWAQSCPFVDSTENSQPDILVTNTKTGETLFFAGLLPHLIIHHGFFEGKNAGHWGGDERISYRMEPNRLIQFFHLSPKRFLAEPIR